MADPASEVHQIKTLYPEERIAKSKARLESVWHRKSPEDGIPHVFISFPFPSKLHGLLMDFAGYDAETALAYQLEAMYAYNHAHLPFLTGMSDTIQEAKSLEDYDDACKTARATSSSGCRL